MTKVAVGCVASLAVCGCLAVLPDVAAAAPSTRYVATTGSDDTNDCLVRTAPCRTVQHAVDAASPGDTVSIGTGTYDESVRVRKNLDLRGASAADTTIVGGAGKATPGITVVGLGSTLTGSIADLSVQDVARAPGIAAQNVDLAVTGVRVVHSQAGLTSYAGSLTVADSVFSADGGADDPFGGGGILVASRAVIERSTVSARSRCAGGAPRRPDRRDRRADGDAHHLGRGAGAAGHRPHGRGAPRPSSGAPPLRALSSRGVMRPRGCPPARRSGPRWTSRGCRRRPRASGPAVGSCRTAR